MRKRNLYGRPSQTFRVNQPQIPSDGNNHKSIRPKLRAPKAETAREANIAPIISILQKEQTEVLTHVVSRVKLKNFDFQKKYIV